MIRQVGFVVGLAWQRVTRRGSGALLAAAGIAVGAALLAGLLVGATVARDRSVSQATARIPDAARAIRAVWFGVPASAGEAQPVLDRQLRAALRDLGLGDPVPLVLFRESTLGGRFAGLAAVDGLAPHVVLRSGRLPRPCRPRRCEVLRLRGEGRLPNAPGLRLVQVGTASLRSQQLFGDFLAPTDNALADAQLAPALREAARYHLPPPAPLVVAEGVAGLSASPVLDAAYRSYAWVWPLSAGTPRVWEVDGLVRRVDRARAALSAESGSFALSAPEEELRAAERAAAAAGRRLLLVGGEAAALLLAFAVLAAGAMRRDLDAARLRLGWHGARRWQLQLLTVAESALVGVLGTLVGFAAGLAVGSVAAAIAGAPAGAVLSESVVSAVGLGLVVAAAAAAVLVLAVALWARPRGARRLGPAGGAALAAVAVAVALLASGAADEERLAEGSGALGLLLVPALLAFAAAVAAAGLLAPLARALGRAARSLPLRLAGLSLARGPGPAAVTVAFLVLAFSLAFLAEGYRSTLSRAEADQAAFRVPLDVLVREDLSRLVPVSEAATPEAFARLAPGVRVAPVTRVSASAGRAERVSGVTVLGLPPDVLPRLRVWREGWADRDREALVRAIQRDDSGRLAGVDVPADARTVTLPAADTLVELRALVETTSGRIVVVPLERVRGSLRAALPSAARGGRIVALDLEPPRIIERGADAGRALRGTLALGAPSFDGVAGPPLAGWIGTGGVDVRAAGPRLVASYVLTPQRRGRLRPRQSTDGDPPPVLATPRLAELAGGPGGLLPLQVGGGTVPVRVAAVVERFPGATGDVLVGDGGALQTAIDTEVPGAAGTSEIWLEVPSGSAGAVDAALSRPPFRALESLSRRALEADARRDPLAHGTLVALLAAASVALLLAVAGLVLTVRTDLRDDRGELHDLETQGALPSLLARFVRARGMVVAIASLVAGAGGGLLLALLVTRVVTVTARAGVAEPPLVATFDVPILVAGGATFLLASWLFLVLATRRVTADVATGFEDRP
ncbi:MAG TPA: hypothetical protein VFR43_02500 [Gaiellaceae bacterium]|nr:hypothetical protein [Gaiellaceae bacterium]